jgi:ferredoxin-type protein NapF
MAKPQRSDSLPSRRALLTGRVSTRAPIAVIGEACLARHNIVCRTCNESCDAGAILIRLAVGSAGLPQVDAGACTGCGDCAPVCPAGAIVLQPAPAEAMA